MLLDPIQAVGHLSITLFGPDGAVKERREIDNLVVTTGRAWLAQRMTSAATLMSHMGVGTGATAPALGDTALQVQLVRVALTSQSTASNVATFEADFAPGVGTGAITEAGIFNAASAGTMLNRATFAEMNKGAGDAIKILWTVTQS